MTVVISGPSDAFIESVVPPTRSLKTAEVGTGEPTQTQLLPGLREMRNKRSLESVHIERNI